MKKYEIKSIDGGVLDVDDKTRRVKTAWNKTGIKDSDKDIIESSAYDKTIKERGPKAKNLIWHLTDHRPSLKDAIGKPTELMMEGEHLVAITDIPNTTWGNDVLEFYKTGIINQHSIGFATIKKEVFHDDDWLKRYTVIKEVQLYEGSAVLWGANEHTPTLSVGKSESDSIECPYCDKPTKNIEAGMGYILCSNCNKTFSSQTDVQKEYFKTLEEINSFAKLFKSGHLSDQCFELIEMKTAQHTEKLKTLFELITQPALKAVEPNNERMLDVITTFNNSFNSTANDSRRKAATAA